MSSILPVGTLCIVRSTVYPRLLGRICEVVAHGHMSGCQYAVKFPDDTITYGAKRHEIDPIAPPGDPDAVPHDVSEPELVEIFK